MDVQGSYPPDLVGTPHLLKTVLEVMVWVRSKRV